jgi:hypothetical protein
MIVIISCEDKEKDKILQLLMNQFKRSFINFDGVGVGGCQLDYNYDGDGREIFPFLYLSIQKPTILLEALSTYYYNSN